VVFDSAADGRLVELARPLAGERAELAYDGRSFLARSIEFPASPVLFADGFETADLGCWSAVAGGPTGGGGAGCFSDEGASTDPVYSSAGLLHALRKRPAPAGAGILQHDLHFGSRPVAILTVDGATATWTYLTTDHLGTPVLATDSGGAEVWSGGFEPFGADYTAAPSAADAGVFLRLPGQWDDETWQEASLGAEVSYNVYRWYQHRVARYTVPDPLGFSSSLSSYLYGSQNPLVFTDPFGLYTTHGSGGFKKRVDDGFAEIKKGLDQAVDDCCEQYFTNLGVPLRDWVTPGGPPYVREANANQKKALRAQDACGFAQKGTPFTYFWIDPDCRSLRKPSPCAFASILLHEIGHLARKDTTDNEPPDFFKICRLGCVRPGDFR
jgi:RHS repeat-associated protein